MIQFDINALIATHQIFPRDKSIDQLNGIDLMPADKVLHTLPGKYIKAIRVQMIDMPKDEEL